MANENNKFTRAYQISLMGESTYFTGLFTAFAIPSSQAFLATMAGHMLYLPFSIFFAYLKTIVSLICFIKAENSNKEKFLTFFLTLPASVTSTVGAILFIVMPSLMGLLAPYALTGLAVFGAISNLYFAIESLIKWRKAPIAELAKFYKYDFIRNVFYFLMNAAFAVGMGLLMLSGVAPIASAVICASVCCIALIGLITSFVKSYHLKAETDPAELPLLEKIPSQHKHKVHNDYHYTHKLWQRLDQIPLPDAKLKLCHKLDKKIAALHREYQQDHNWLERAQKPKREAKMQVLFAIRRLMLTDDEFAQDLATPRAYLQDSTLQFTLRDAAALKQLGIHSYHDLRRHESFKKFFSLAPQSFFKQVAHTHTLIDASEHYFAKLALSKN